MAQAPDGNSGWSDRELAERILRGDPRAEAILMAKFEPGLLMMLRRLTRGDVALAQDICQDTLVVLLRRLRTTALDDPERVAAFAAQIARNLAIAAHRKFLRRRTRPSDEHTARVEDPAEGPTRRLERETTASAVAEILAELSTERDRDVLRRFYLEEEDRERICADLGLTESHFNQVVFRARRRMREILERRGVEAHDLLGFALL